jgi:hypothetical protein
MSTIKKGFTEVHALLEANQGKKVSAIMDQLLELMEGKSREKSHYTDDAGLWVFCYYHKEWELTSQVEYGSKVGTATSLNSMCKVGTNQWTKQQREFKKAKSDLLNMVAVGELAIEDIQAKIDELEELRGRIVPLKDFHHEEALKDPRQLPSEE